MAGRPIKKLKDSILKKQKEILCLQSEVDDMLDGYTELSAPFQVGDMVKNTRNGRYGRVATLKAEVDDFGESIKFTGQYRPLNKDGSVSRRIMQMKPHEIGYWQLYKVDKGVEDVSSEHDESESSEEKLESDVGREAEEGRGSPEPETEEEESIQLEEDQNFARYF